MKKYSFIISSLIVLFAILNVTGAQTTDGIPDDPKIYSFKHEFINGRTVSIYLPESYYDSDNEYPVLLVMDSEDFFLPISGIVSYYSKIGKCPEMIIIGIDPDDRWHNYTPTKADIPDGTPLPTSGGSEHFSKFIEKDLIPEIDSQFRTSSLKILFGHSIAGLFVVNKVFEKETIFSGFIATSPSLWWDNELLAKKAHEYSDFNFSHSRYLYFTIGNEGPTMLSPIINFKDRLSLHHDKIIWEFRHYEQTDHQTMPIKAFVFGIEFLFCEGNLEF